MIMNLVPSFELASRISRLVRWFSLHTTKQPKTFRLDKFLFQTSEVSTGALMTLKGFLDQLKEDGSRSRKAKSIFPVVASECLLGRGENCDLRLGTPSQVLEDF